MLLSPEHLYWVHNKVTRYCQWDQSITAGMTDLEFKRLIRLWLLWCRRKGYITVFGDRTPNGCVIARPCQVFSAELNHWCRRKEYITTFGAEPTGCAIARPCRYFSTDLKDIFFAEEDGDSLWVDFLWAPGQWPAVCDFLLSTGKLYGGWERRENFAVHTIDIKKLCSRHIRQQVEG